MSGSLPARDVGESSFDIPQGWLVTVLALQRITLGFKLNSPQPLSWNLKAVLLDLELGTGTSQKTVSHPSQGYNLPLETPAHAFQG